MPKLNSANKNKLPYVKPNKPTQTIAKASAQVLQIKQTRTTNYDDLVDRQLFSVDVKKKFNHDNYMSIIKCIGGDIFGDNCCYSHVINQRVGSRYYPLRKILYINFVASEPKHSLSTICTKNGVNCCNVNHFRIKNRDSQKCRYVDLINNKNFLDRCGHIIDIVNNIDYIIYNCDDYYAACDIFNIFNNIEQTYFSIYRFKRYLVKNNLLNGNMITIGIHALSFKLATDFSIVVSLVKSCGFTIDVEPSDANVVVVCSDVQKYLFFPQSLITSFSLSTFGNMYISEHDWHARLNATITTMKRTLKIE